MDIEINVLDHKDNSQNQKPIHSNNDILDHSDNCDDKNNLPTKNNDNILDHNDDNENNLHQNNNNMIDHNGNNENNLPINSNDVNIQDNCIKSNINVDLNTNNDNLLSNHEVPHKTENNSSEVDSVILVVNEGSDKLTSFDKTRVKEIESEIAHYKNEIALLEEAEVSDDSTTSPYIISEKYKAKIVQLYTELCKITGDEPVKQHKVRLRGIPDRPQGPVKCLEEFLNNNIGEDGEPLFPDFQDVALCVATANRRDNLGWTPQQIINEANALFTHCGRALQKRRQQREWRDLMYRVDFKDIHDPADTDPELLKRLKENKRIAQKKEEDLIQMFTNLEYKRKNKNEQQKLIITNEESSDDSDQENANLEPKMEVNNKRVSSVADSKSNEIDVPKIKEESGDISAILDLTDDFAVTIVEVLDPFMVIEISSESEEEDGMKT